MDFSQTLPAIDQNLCNVWAEEDQNKYNKLPYYLVAADVERRKRWQTFTPLLNDTIKWTPNLASTLKMVIVEKSPIIRQFARPNTIQVDPLTDIYNVNERTVETVLYWQDFESPHFRFLPSFQDFMKGNLIPARQNINEQVEHFEDVFYRTNLWDYAPNVYFAGHGLVQAPTGTTSGASNKTDVWLAAQCQTTQVGNAGYLTFQELFKALSIAEDEIGMTPFMGSGTPGGDSMPLDERYCLIVSPQAWNQFTNDPWLKENRPLNMDIVTGPYRGDFFGRIRSKLERYPLRFAYDDSNGITWHQPEATELTTTAWDYNRTKPHQSYAKHDVSQLEVAWLIGGRCGRRIETGPPPEMFAGSVSDPSKIAGMTWNGQIYSTRNFLIPCKDSDGNPQWKTNDRGRYVRFQGTLSCGIIIPYAFNAMPIVFRRRVGITNTVVS